jgi:hypothetical protein
MKRDDVMKVEAGGRGHGTLVHSSNVHHPYRYHGIVLIVWGQSISVIVQLLLYSRIMLHPFCHAAEHSI